MPFNLFQGFSKHRTSFLSSSLLLKVSRSLFRDTELSDVKEILFPPKAAFINCDVALEEENAAFSSAPAPLRSRFSISASLFFSPPFYRSFAYRL